MARSPSPTSSPWPPTSTRPIPLHPRPPARPTCSSSPPSLPVSAWTPPSLVQPSPSPPLSPYSRSPPSPSSAAADENCNPTHQPRSLYNYWPPPTRTFRRLRPLCFCNLPLHAFIMHFAATNERDRGARERGF